MLGVLPVLAAVTVAPLFAATAPIDQRSHHHNQDKRGDERSNRRNNHPNHQDKPGDERSNRRNNHPNHHDHNYNYHDHYNNYHIYHDNNHHYNYHDNYYNFHDHYNNYIYHDNNHHNNHNNHPNPHDKHADERSNRRNNHPNHHDKHGDERSNRRNNHPNHHDHNYNYHDHYNNYHNYYHHHNDNNYNYHDHYNNYIYHDNNHHNNHNNHPNPHDKHGDERSNRRNNHPNHQDKPGDERSNRRNNHPNHHDHNYNYDDHYNNYHIYHDSNNHNNHHSNNHNNHHNHHNNYNYHDHYNNYHIYHDNNHNNHDNNYNYHDHYNNYHIYHDNNHNNYHNNHYHNNHHHNYYDHYNNYHIYHDNNHNNHHHNYYDYHYNNYHIYHDNNHNNHHHNYYDYHYNNYYIYHNNLHNNHHNYYDNDDNYPKTNAEETNNRTYDHNYKGNSRFISDYATPAFEAKVTEVGKQGVPHLGILNMLNDTTTNATFEQALRMLQKFDEYAASTATPTLSPIIALGVSVDVPKVFTWHMHRMRRIYLPNLIVALSHFSYRDAGRPDCQTMPPSVLRHPNHVSLLYGHTLGQSVSQLKQLLFNQLNTARTVSVTLKGRWYQPKYPDVLSDDIGNFTFYQSCTNFTEDQDVAPALICDMDLPTIEKNYKYDRDARAGISFDKATLRTLTLETEKSLKEKLCELKRNNVDTDFSLAVYDIDFDAPDVLCSTLTIRGSYRRLKMVHKLRNFFRDRFRQKAQFQQCKNLRV
ncbi:probable serine/threonine-protein kinase clkA [Dermacentor albipictus]|uniref:probable serine/threonine-protein kinase clkA n=1 Tax=Dermacentor albipictus TaxID=60249 RepID=UPI0031FC42E6